MAEPGHKRERKDVQRNLERVLQAAHDLFSERGGDVTMEEVARRAGVGVGTVYRRFPSKEQLFAAVSRAVCSDMQQCLAQAAGEAGEPVPRLRALLVIQYRRCQQQAALLEPGLSLSQHEGCASGAEQQLYATLQELLHEIIQQAQRDGLVEPGDATLQVAFCLELLNPRAFQHFARLIGDRPEDVAEHVLRFMLRGLGRR